MDHSHWLTSTQVLTSLILPILIISSFLFPITTSQESPFLYKICKNESAGSYTKTDPFANNLKNVLDNLVDQTPKHDGFWTTSSGGAYGLALCRGDVSSDHCDFCLYDARCKITQRCVERAAIVWYDNCLIKYSDHDFFGEIDTDNRIRMYNIYNATDAKGFNKTARDLLQSLKKKASKSAMMFAQGSAVEKKENVTIYGMAQCGRDLSRGNCTSCLDYAINHLPAFTATTTPVGGRTLTGSCSVRYEEYVFLDTPTKNKAVNVKMIA
ncbi:cysteine-rich receptor-like protein kinase [Striga asiatica]|uniref:Cysteine-rich receptor-like protein kinase n=1 Tax=Striga asiatica TaxID=4170 RepID=A0A5A7PFR0_STRAF|nr:cysteine-rich receptor-like protein kinase [Striga asiatica]